MFNENELNFVELGYSTGVYNSETTLVLNENGGPALQPLYIIVIKDENNEITLRLSNVHFCSEYLIDNNTGDRVWSDGIGKAKALAVKIQLKGVINLKYWKDYKC